MTAPATQLAPPPLLKALEARPLALPTLPPADLTQPTDGVCTALETALPHRHRQALLGWSSYLQGTSSHLILRVSLISFSHDPRPPPGMLGPLLLDQQHLGCHLTRGSQDPGHMDYNVVGNVPESWPNARHGAKRFPRTLRPGRRPPP